MFLILSATEPRDIPVRDERAKSLGELAQAQALGDFMTLSERVRLAGNAVADAPATDGDLLWLLKQQRRVNYFPKSRISYKSVYRSYGINMPGEAKRTGERKWLCSTPDISLNLKNI